MIPRQIISSVSRADDSPARVARQFLRLLAQRAQIVTAGSQQNPLDWLFSKGLRPQHRIEIFDTEFYLSNIRQIPELRFFVAYVVQNVNQQRKIFPRIIYKDLSLAWRSASHYALIDGGIWVGKGDVRIAHEGAYQIIESNEATTDLPLEMQTALEDLLAWTRRAVSGTGILERVLRRAPINRVEPYADFQKPRRAAQADPRNLINRGKSIARFSRRNDPTSLKIVSGFEPDFEFGVIERATSKSRLYGGELRRFRILSRNREIQYYFYAGPRHAWLMPPQAMTTSLSSYGVRTVDVVADDRLFLPGYEYHHWEATATGGELYSQIPQGFAGEICPFDDQKADASAWLDKLPVIVDFRRRLLGG